MFCQLFEPTALVRRTWSIWQELTLERRWNLRSLVPNPVFVLALPQNRVRSVVFNVLLFSAGRQAIEKTCKECRWWLKKPLSSWGSAVRDWFQILIFHFQPQGEVPTTSSDGEKDLKTSSNSRKWTIHTNPQQFSGNINFNVYITIITINRITISMLNQCNDDDIDTGDMSGEELIQLLTDRKQRGQHIRRQRAT